jgi:hypothetical protein
MLMNFKTWNRIVATASCLLLSALCCPGQDTYDTLKVGTNTFRNARVIQANPATLLIGHEEGFQRVKLQDLPDELKSKYPYDPRKAAEYLEQQAAETHQRRAQDNAAARTALLDKESRIGAQRRALQQVMKRLDADIRTQRALAKGKKAKSPERTELDRLLRKKMETQDDIWLLQDQLQNIQNLRKAIE